MTLHHVFILHTSSLSWYIKWHLTNIPIDLEIPTVETEQKLGRKWGMTCNRWHQPETLWFRIGVSGPVILIVIVLPSLKWYKTKYLNKQYLNCSGEYDNYLYYCDVWKNKLKADKSYRLETQKWSCCSIRNISLQWITWAGSVAQPWIL